MKHFVLWVSLLFLTVTALAQESIRPVDVVAIAAEKYQPVNISLFEKAKNPVKQTGMVLSDYVEVDVLSHGLADVLQKEPYFLELDVPVAANEMITLQLVRTDIYEDNDHYIAEPGQRQMAADPGKHYRGIIKGKTETVVAVSFFKDEVMGLAAGLYGSNLVIGKLDNSKNHVIYLDHQIAKHQDFTCEIPDDFEGYTEAEINYDGSMDRTGPQCVRFYIEVNNDIYNNKGSGTTNFVTGFMNQVMTLYANENINTTLMPLVIWTSASPYTSNDTAQLLSQFQNYRTSWNGDLGQLIGYAGGGGIAAGFAGICASNRRNSMSYSGIQSSYSNVPTFSWTVQVVTHEYGHTFGSRHTHACVWNGNNTAIDGCAGYVEGNCSRPGNPSAGGTIMSYCHMTNVGINLANGFGTQPGNVIRNRVANGSCLTDCSGGTNPDPEPDCNKNEVVVRVTTDRYPGETSWTLKNSSGATVAIGSGYTTANSTYTETLCLDNGCYTFEIKDSYGDGICCSYGNGSYSVTVNGSQVANGGNFQSSQSHQICTGSVPEPEPEPECVDFSLKFKTDNYPGEISWTVKDANNAVIGQGSGYTNKNYEYSANGCLEPGCYTVTFTDSYGDGFCCSYGQGYYRVFEGTTTKLDQWANFGRTVTHTVCIGTGMTEQQLLPPVSEIPPFTIDFAAVSPFKDVLKIQFSGLREPVTLNSLTVTDVNGKAVYSQADVSTAKAVSIMSANWKPGIYFINFIKDNQQESVKVMKNY